MYEVTVFDSLGGEIDCYCDPWPPSVAEESILLRDYPEGAWIDVSRLPEPDWSCDTINFRDEVEADLEPFSLEPFIEELLR